MATNQDHIPIFKQMLRSARQVVMGSIDGITEPKIRQAPARDEWVVVQLMSHTTEQQTFQGFAFPERSIFLGLGMERGLILHESAHLLLGQAMGNNALPTPAWLDEGFASYMDPSVKIFSGGGLNSRPNPPRSLKTGTGHPHSIGPFSPN